MKFQASATYSGGIDRVRDVLLSDELAQERASALGINDVEFSTADSSAITKVNVPSDQLPEVARKFLSRGLRVSIHATATGTGQQIVIDHDIEIDGAPARASLQLTLTEQMPHTTLGVAHGDIKVSVPFIGGKIEGAAVEKIQKLFDADTQLVNRLL